MGGVSLCTSIGLGGSLKSQVYLTIVAPLTEVVDEDASRPTVRGAVPVGGSGVIIITAFTTPTTSVHVTSTDPFTEPIKAVTFAFYPTCLEVSSVKVTFAIPLVVTAESGLSSPLFVQKYTVVPSGTTFPSVLITSAEIIEAPPGTFDSGFAITVILPIPGPTSEITSYFNKITY